MIAWNDHITSRTGVPVLLHGTQNTLDGNYDYSANYKDCMLLLIMDSHVEAYNCQLAEAYIEVQHVPHCNYLGFFKVHQKP